MPKIQAMAMKRNCFGVLLIVLQLIFSPICFGQIDSAIILKEVVVSGLKITKINETPVNISSLHVQKKS